VSERARQHLVVVLLTFNSAEVIAGTVRAAKQVADEVFAVDSFSTDGTPEILRQLGCSVVQRTFRHYADQRNWAIAQVAERFDWQLHLDADEIADERALAEVRRALAAPGDCDGFIFKRRTYFMGRALRFGGASNFHMRLFRSGRGRCEDRLYDQHFLCSGKTRQLRGLLHDMNVGSLTEWIARHNRWSSLEAEELLREDREGADLVAGRLSADPRERRRYYKGVYYAAPKLLRALLYFAYRYFVQLGILDGRAGFLYAFFQAFWFRMLVDAKLIERDPAARPADAPPAPKLALPARRA
jgi:glycosyltransferase involved in cell wall biosynthesis